MLSSDLENKFVQSQPAKTVSPVLARVSGLGVFGNFVLLGAQMKAPVVLIPQRRSRCGKEFKGHSAGNQRQDAKGDIYHACREHQ